MGKIVAFGVGSRCSSPDNIDEDGCALLDCHALAMARRALLQYVIQVVFFQKSSTGNNFFNRILYIVLFGE